VPILLSLFILILYVLIFGFLINYNKSIYNGSRKVEKKIERVDDYIEYVGMYSHVPTELNVEIGLKRVLNENELNSMTIKILNIISEKELLDAINTEYKKAHKVNVSSINIQYCVEEDEKEMHWRTFGISEFTNQNQFKTFEWDFFEL